MTGSSTDSGEEANFPYVTASKSDRRKTRNRPLIDVGLGDEHASEILANMIVVVGSDT